jgi:pSer/pThr/pTyr-binding forkhead associated (FHA) protein
VNYKYLCRPCPPGIRNRCIQECNEAPSVKAMMRRAFDAGRDTQEMWRRLQMNCLLVRMDEEAARQGSRRSVLGRRLASEAQPVEAVEREAPVTPPPSPPVSVPVQEPARRPAAVRVEEREQELAQLRYCLVLQGGKHRIALPAEGKIVLGRFDAATNAAPDVDLSYDDREKSFISRRHARIIGHGTWYEIEDMGSTNGTRVNGTRLEIGQKVRLQSGDQVALGHCNFLYIPLPEVKASYWTTSPEAYLWVNFTGQRFVLPSWGESVIGRSDISIGLSPDIDLSQAEDAAQVVARRHAKIIVRGGRHHLEDLGSANGTKVNGVNLRLNEQRLLEPGDHIWLGGCVLAYDIRLDPAKDNTSQGPSRSLFG